MHGVTVVRFRLLRIELNFNGNAWVKEVHAFSNESTKIPFITDGFGVIVEVNPVNKNVIVYQVQTGEAWTTFLRITNKESGRLTLRHFWEECVFSYEHVNDHTAEIVRSSDGGTLGTMHFGWSEGEEDSSWPPSPGRGEGSRPHSSRQ